MKFKNGQHVKIKPFDKAINPAKFSRMVWDSYLETNTVLDGRVRPYSFGFINSKFKEMDSITLERNTCKCGTFLLDDLILTPIINKGILSIL